MQPPREFLVVQLWGPMASWGEIAVGERRGSWPRPSRSGVLGLVAAALGIERSDAEALQHLEAETGFAVRVDHPGRPLRDYHTAQAPSRKRGVRWATRRDELAPSNDLNTILSERGYYTEMHTLVALWARTADPRFPLLEIAGRLTEPVFTLYLGRKSCPPGLPLAPRIVTTESLPKALDAYGTAAAALVYKLGIRRPPPGSVRSLWLGEEDANALGLSAVERTQRRDGIRDRSRWLFNDRAEVRVDIREAAP